MVRAKDILSKDEESLGSHQLYDPKLQSEFLRSETGRIRAEDKTYRFDVNHTQESLKKPSVEDTPLKRLNRSNDKKHARTKAADIRKKKARYTQTSKSALKQSFAAGLYAFNKADEREDDTDIQNGLSYVRKSSRGPDKKKLQEEKKGIPNKPLNKDTRKKDYKAKRKLEKEKTKLERKKKYARKAQFKAVKGTRSVFGRYTANKIKREAETKTLLLLLQSATPALIATTFLVLVLIIGGISVSILLVPQSKGFGTLNTNEQAIALFLQSKNVDDLHIAAIMGNLWWESKCDPSAIESTGEGHGLAQWSFGRKERLFSYASDRGKNWNDMEVQLELLWDELNGLRWTPSTWQHFLSINNLDEATEFFMSSFEAPGIPHLEERVSRAHYYYTQLTTTLSGDGTEVVHAARSQMGKPYVLGAPQTFAVGIESAAYDCSGLVKWAYTQAGIELQGRTAATICESLLSEGREIRASEAQPGDLVGWRGDMFGDGWDHVAIYAGDDRIIEAGGMSDCVNESIASQRGISAYFRIFH